jgi:alpha-glucoside transport system permease protein
MTEATLESAEARREPRTLSERLVRLLGRTPIHLALGFIALIWLLPSVGLLITSFRPREDIQVSGWWEILGNLRLTLDNYSQVLSGQGMLPAFLNSVYITVPSTILPLLIASLAAFGFAWVRFPLRDTLFLIVIGLMMVPIQLALIPILELFANFQLNRSFVGIWLAHTAFSLPFGIFLLRNFFITLPRDLIEAARIDGASNVNIFRRVVIPLSVPALASYGIFQFLWVWNDLLMALVFAPSAGKPMTVQVTRLLGTYGSEWHILAASSFLVMLVPLIVFFSLQRYFVQGLLAGSVK